MAAAVQHLNQQRDVIFFPNENTTWQERLTACTEIGGGSVLGAAAVYQFWAVLAPSAAPFGTLMRAAEFGIKPYWKLRQLTAGTGLISHHIIEKRFAGILGVSQRTIDSVALTVQEHQVFTRAWRQFISYGDGTTSATKETIWDTAQKMYANYPVLLEAARKALGMQ